jgi:hypothetical protein
MCINNNVDKNVYTYWRHLWNKSNDYKGSKGIVKKIIFKEFFKRIFL